MRFTLYHSDLLESAVAVGLSNIFCNPNLVHVVVVVHVQ